MIADPDEDALAWAGETDPSHVAGPTATLAPRVEFVPAEAPKQTSSSLLISYGVLGGVYLIYTLGWVISVQRLSAIRSGSTELLSEIMFQLGEFLAIASPAVWIAAVFILTRGRKPIVRLSWLLLGLIAVLPWPLVLGAWV